MIRLVQDNLGKYFVVDFDSGTRYSVAPPGSGSFRAATQLYGQPIRHASDLPEPWRQAQEEGGLTGDVIYLDRGIGYSDGGSAVQLFGGPNEMEQVVAGLRPDPLTGEFIPQPQSSTTQTGVTFEPTPGVEGVGSADGQTLSYAEQTQRLMPWMPAEMAQVYADEWASTGDPALAIAAVRQHPDYDKHFPGMRRPDGTLRLGSEAEYLSTVMAYEQTLLDYGLNPEVFQDNIIGMLEGETSPQEFRQRINALNQGIVNNAPEVAAWFEQQYGLTLDGSGDARAALLAMASDAEVGSAILDQRIAVSQVAGEGSRFGFSLSAGFAESLVNLGVDQGQARQVFGSAQRQLPALESMAVRFGDSDSTVELEEFTGAVVGGDLEQQRRFERLAAQERSQFSTQDAFVRDRQGFFGGLRAR